MDKKVNHIINQYRKNLEAMGINIKKVILYGSHASGKGKEESDIDLVVVSDDFKDMDLWERLCLLGRARIGIKKPMEILGVTEEEYKDENSATFLRDEVKSKGIEVR